MEWRKGKKCITKIYYFLFTVLKFLFTKETRNSFGTDFNVSLLQAENIYTSFLLMRMVWGWCVLLFLRSAYINYVDGSVELDSSFLYFYALRKKTVRVEDIIMHWLKKMHG